MRKRLIFLLLLAIIGTGAAYGQTDEGTDEIPIELPPEYTLDRGDSGQDGQVHEWETDSEFTEDSGEGETKLEFDSESEIQK